jgi:hypothetical protein
MLLWYLTIAAESLQERWPVVFLIPPGVALIRWRRPIGRALGSFYGVEYPPNPDPDPSRATRESAQMFWSAGMLIFGVFLIVVPAVILAGV